MYLKLNILTTYSVNNPVKYIGEYVWKCVLMETMTHASYNHKVVGNQQLILWSQILKNIFELKRISLSFVKIQNAISLQSSLNSMWKARYATVLRDIWCHTCSYQGRNSSFFLKITSSQVVIAILYWNLSSNLKFSPSPFELQKI